MKSKMTRFHCFSLMFLFSISAVSKAFTLNSSTSSNFKGWTNPSVKFQINLSNCPAGVDVMGIIGDALAVWNNVATSKLTVELVGETTSTTYSDPITIVCDTNYGSGGLSADSSPGAAVIQPSSGDTITSGIMYLNASSGLANIGNLNRDLVAVVLAHEIGHLLGLGHSQDLKALMYYDASLKTTLGLAQDDVDGVTYLYPRDELSGDKPLGCAMVQDSKPKSGLGIFMGWIALLLPLVTCLVLRKKYFKTA